MKTGKIFKKLAGLLLAFVMIFAAMPAINTEASLVVAVHFKNTGGWSAVHAYSWGDDGEVFGAWPGTDISDKKQGDWYTALITDPTSSQINIIFSDGNGKQTIDLVVDASQSDEWWLVPNGDDAGKITCTVATSQADAEAGNSATITPSTPDTPANEIVTDSIMENGNQVTFYYENANASSVSVGGSFNGWSMTEMNKDGSVFSYTFTMEPGTHEYKFIVDGNWIVDPLNPEEANGNSVFTLAGDGSNTGNSGNTGSGEAATGNVKYVIYGYSADAGRNTTSAAALWVWDLAAGGEGQEISFTATEDIDGKTWLKAEFEFAQTTELGLILKSAGGWDWKGYDADLSYSNAENADSTIYIVDGHDKVYTSVEDIVFDTPVDETEDKADTTDKDDKKDTTTNTKKEPMKASTIAWIVVGIVVAIAAVIAVIVCKKMTANLPNPEEGEEVVEAEEAAETEENKEV